MDTSESDQTVVTDVSGATMRVDVARVRGSDAPAAFAPTDASGERDFLAERLALFARVAFLASTGFLVVGQILSSPARTIGLPWFERVPILHIAATAFLLAVLGMLIHFLLES